VKLLKEPLVHFLLLGGALFALDAWRGDAGGSAPGRPAVVVSEGRVEHLASMFEQTWQRPPTAAELKGLVDDFVLEEIYYREALALDLDHDDTLVRRRMRQKLEMATDDLAAVPPTEKELEDYLAEHPDKFAEEPRYRLRQVFVSPERHEDPRAHAAALAERLRAGEDVEGDPTLLPESFERLSERGIDRQFGRGFAERVAPLEPGRWSDPLESGYGLHLVLVEDKQAGRIPELDEVRTQVRREWEHERRQRSRARLNRELLEKYEVVVDWPGDAGEP